MINWKPHLRIHIHGIVITSKNGWTTDWDFPNLRDSKQRRRIDNWQKHAQWNLQTKHSTAGHFLVSLVQDSKIQTCWFAQRHVTGSSLLFTSLHIYLFFVGYSDRFIASVCSLPSKLSTSLSRQLDSFFLCQCQSLMYLQARLSYFNLATTMYTSCKFQSNLEADRILIQCPAGKNDPISRSNILVVSKPGPLSEKLLLICSMKINRFHVVSYFVDVSLKIYVFYRIVTAS